MNHELRFRNKSAVCLGSSLRSLNLSGESAVAIGPHTSEPTDRKLVYHDCELEGRVCIRLQCWLSIGLMCTTTEVPMRLLP
jgi:hypothetical protein